MFGRRVGSSIWHTDKTRHACHVNNRALLSGITEFLLLEHHLDLLLHAPEGSSLVDVVHEIHVFGWGIVESLESARHASVIHNGIETSMVFGDVGMESDDGLVGCDVNCVEGSAAAGLRNSGHDLGVSVSENYTCSQDLIPTSLPFFSFLPVTMTFQPLFARRSAVSLPMPVVAPMIRQVLCSAIVFRGIGVKNIYETEWREEQTAERRVHMINNSSGVGVLNIGLPLQYVLIAYSTDRVVYETRGGTCLTVLQYAKKTGFGPDKTRP